VHTLKAGEVEKNLGLTIRENMEDVEGGDLTIVSPSGEAPKMLSVLHINLHKSRTASAELLIALEKWPADVTFVQEPWTAAGNIVDGLKSSTYNVFCAPTVSRDRTVVLVRKGIQTYLMSHYSTDDLTLVLLENDKKRLMAASCYMAHGRLAPPEELRRLADEASFKNQHLVIGTDANSHHVVWGVRKPRYQRQR